MWAVSLNCAKRNDSFPKLFGLFTCFSRLRSTKTCFSSSFIFFSHRQIDCLFSNKCSSVGDSQKFWHRILCGRCLINSTTKTSAVHMSIYLFSHCNVIDHGKCQHWENWNYLTREMLTYEVVKLSESIQKPVENHTYKKQIGYDLIDSSQCFSLIYVVECGLHI